MKTVMRLLAVAAVSLALTACATATPETTSTVPHVGGFWWGLWNGMTCGFSFIGSLFDPTIAIYQTPNNGAWYDFGFVLGVGALFGGGSSATR